jgi:hypothetical protein
MDCQAAGSRGVVLITYRTGGLLAQSRFPGDSRVHSRLDSSCLTPVLQMCQWLGSRCSWAEHVTQARCCLAKQLIVTWPFAALLQARPLLSHLAGPPHRQLCHLTLRRVEMVRGRESDMPGLCGICV